MPQSNAESLLSMPSEVVVPEEKPPELKLELPRDIGEQTRKEMEAAARAYERRCWVETGAPPKWDLLLRVDPKFAAAVRAEADRIYMQAIEELTARRAREAALQRQIEEEARRTVRQRLASAPPQPSAVLGDVLPMLCRYLSKQGDDASLRSLSATFRLANLIAMKFRWATIWDKTTVRASLKGRVVNLKPGQIATTKEQISRALDTLIDVICDPEVSPEETRRALDQFLSTHTKGFPPPKDLTTKAIEFTSAKSLWLKRYRFFYPGADSTQQGQKIPDFVSRLGPGDNVRASGFNQETPRGREPVLHPDDKMADKMDSCYNSVINDIQKKVEKYKREGRVVVTVDASTAPWMDAAVLRERIRQKVDVANLHAVFLLKDGGVEQVWP